MKKYALILALPILFLPIVTFAWDDCPYGLVNDPYPGECNKYIDTDDDGICDHSQPAPEDRVEVAPEAEAAPAAPVVTEETELSVPAPSEEIEPPTAPMEDSRSENLPKIIAVTITTVIGLLAILGYVQYKKRKN